MIWFQIIATLVFGLLGAVLYRLGGAAKTDSWYSFLQNTKSRDFGVPACSMIVFWIWTIGGYWSSWQYWLGCFFSFGALFGAMTTYWKKKGTDAKWYNWMFVGMGYSTAFLPIAIAVGDWWGFAIRFVLLTATVTLWKTFMKNAVVSELGAGLLTVLSTVLMVIGLRKRK